MSKLENTLELVYLEKCFFSQKLKKFLDDMKIKYKLIKVSQSTKFKYKSKQIDTFPQLYFTTKKNKYLLGGSDSSIKLVLTIRSMRSIEEVESLKESLKELKIPKKDLIKLSILILS